jgi:hypothetical protein
MHRKSSRPERLDKPNLKIATKKTFSLSYPGLAVKRALRFVAALVREVCSE